MYIMDVSYSSLKGGMKVNAQRLKAAMVLRNFNAERLAKEIGISESALYKKMSGKTDFTLPEVRAIERALVLDIKVSRAIFFDS